MQYRSLSNGVELPMIGYGTFQIKDAAQCEQCVSEALEAGYRLFDTAASYENEVAIGRALRGSRVPRDALFITTKLWVQDAGYDGTLKAFDSSLKQLGLDYIDLYLLHQPMGDYIGAYRAMEEAYKEGKLKAIGVSLCRGQPRHLHPPRADQDRSEVRQERRTGGPAVERPAGRHRHPQVRPQGAHGAEYGHLGLPAQ